MQTEQALAWYDHRLAEIAKELKEKGSLPRHEFWQRRYYLNPYLLLCSEEELRERWNDIFANVATLTEEGKIGFDLDETKKSQGSMMEAFTHIVEACNSRGGVQRDYIEMGRAELGKYFLSEPPPGVAMFRELPKRMSNCIVKFSRREFLKPMLHGGVVRLAPASFYAKGSHLKSVRDLETRKTLRIPAVHEAMSGQTHVEYEGFNLPIEGGAITMPIEVSDYYLFSACLELDRRMPTDFEADAALVIKDMARFVRSVKKAFKKSFGQADMYAGPVLYFDPFLWRPKGFVPPEMMKHFGFSYQKEHRIVARPIDSKIASEPIFLNIGSMEDYAEIVQ